MKQESSKPKALKDAVGWESKPQVIEVEKGRIRRFAQAVQDANPLWQDEEYAKNARYGSIIAPPTFLQDQAITEFVDEFMAMK